MTIHAAGADFPLWKLNLASLRFRIGMGIWHQTSANGKTTMPATWFRLFNFLREGQSQWYLWDLVRVGILITNSENLRADIARGWKFRI